MEKRQMMVGGVLVVGLLVAGVLALAIGQGSAVAAEQVGRPFRMSTHEVVTEEGPGGGCPFEAVVVEGSGSATHLGQVSVTRTHCFSPFTDPPLTNGHWEMVAANGDRIWGSYSGSLVPTAFDENGVPTRGDIISPYTVDGGTGRFAGASGGGMITGDFDLVAEEGTFQAEGTIKY